MVTDNPKSLRLSAVLRHADGGLLAPLVFGLGRQLIPALRALHERGIVHGDLSPSSVYWAPRGTAKLAYLSPASHFRSLQSSSRDAHLPYMAPEEAQGHARLSSDVYALGAVLWHAATGQLYKPAGADLASRLPSKLPASFGALLERMLAPEVWARPTMVELEDAWEQATSKSASAKEPARVVPDAVPRVALVDDNPVTARLARHLLERSPCDVELFDDPQPLTRGAAATFDLVLLSGEVPGADPGDIVDYMAQAWPELKIVVTTTQPDVPARLRDRTTAALRLPIDLDELGDIINQTARSATPVEPT